MKTKSFRWFFVALALALFSGCQNPNSTGDIIAMRESGVYMDPRNGFYDPWYGGAYVGTGGYGGVGVGISVPLIP
jgi:hypothetical protein